MTEDQRVQGVDLGPDPTRRECERARDALLSRGSLLVRLGYADIDEGHRLDACIAAQAYAFVSR